MTTHTTKDSCNVPGWFFRKAGSLWLCSCGKPWQLAKSGDQATFTRKRWHEWNLNHRVRFEVRGSTWSYKDTVSMPEIERRIHQLAKTMDEILLRELRCDTTPPPPTKGKK